MLNRRMLLFTLLLVGLMTAFWQYFQFAYELARIGAIADSLWSEVYGPPVAHHGYYGFLLAGLSIGGLELMRRRERRAKDRLA